MNLSANIKRLRREADLTQEQLAEVLGVSFQSVSKWERSDGMPDIMLLPSIARFFNMTVDDLLNMDEERRKQESKELDEKLANVDLRLYIDDMDIALLREHVKKYPLDWEKQIQLSWHIFSKESFKEADRWETVEILGRVVEYCSDAAIKAKATGFLVGALSILGGGNPETEKKINKLIDSLPPARCSREMIVSNAYKHTENVKKFAFDAAKAHIEVLNEVFLLLELFGSEKDKTRIKEANAALANLMDLYERG